jgi:hypothetical protein
MWSGCTTSKAEGIYTTAVSRLDRQISELPEEPVMKRLFVFADLLLCE